MKKYKLTDGSEFEVPDEVHQKISEGASYHLTKETESILKDFFGEDFDMKSGTLTSHLKRMSTMSKKVNDTAIETDQKYKSLQIELEALKQKGGGKGAEEIQKLKDEYESQFKTKLETEKVNLSKNFEKQYKEKSFYNEVKARALQLGLKEAFADDDLFQSVLKRDYDVNISEDNNVFVRNKQGTFVQDSKGQITAAAVADSFFKDRKDDFFTSRYTGPDSNTDSELGWKPNDGNKKVSEMSLADVKKMAEMELAKMAK